jgi:hypothetical protein
MGWFLFLQKFDLAAWACGAKSKEIKKRGAM